MLPTLGSSSNGKHVKEISSESSTFVALLKACAVKKDLYEGTRLHVHILKKGLLEKSVYVGTALVSMYAKCGVFGEAHKVHDELSAHNIVAWNAIIAGYTQQGQSHEAFNCLERMQNEGFFPNAVTLTCILNVCGRTGAIEKGRQIHEKIITRGLLEKDIVLGNALIDMYAKCGVLAKAHQVLEELPLRDIVSWSALIAGYVQEGQGHEALTCFEQMQTEGLSGDAVTLICILKACSSTKSIEKGKEVHEKILSKELIKQDIVLGTTLVDMYVKCGVLEKAQEVLKGLSDRDVVSWNSLISGYAEDGQYHNVLHCLEQMQIEGLLPDSVTFMCILKACGSIGAVDKGIKIHNEIVNMGLIEKDIVLGNALVDMYAKCGVLGKAQEVIDQLPIRDIVSWNALISGYAQQGKGRAALNCFEWMQSEGLFPNEVTFLCILSACSHSGLLDEAEMLFRNMDRNYGVSPNIEHQTCMMVSFACEGRFDEAMSIIQVMPSFGSSDAWLALLGACRKWANVVLGELAFNQTIRLDYTCASAYVLMASIFAAAGLQEDAKRVETMRLKYAATSKKQANSMWVDENGIVHSFCAGDTKHPQSKEICINVKAISVYERTYSHSRILANALVNTFQGEAICIVNDVCE